VEATRMNGGAMNLIVGIIVGALLAWAYHQFIG
jgi:hypothetical protein